MAKKWDVPKPGHGPCPFMDLVNYRIEASAPSSPHLGLACSTNYFIPHTSAVGSGLHILCPWLCSELDDSRYGFPRPVLPGGEGRVGGVVFLESPQQEAGLGRQVLWTLPCARHLSLLHWLIIATE